MSGSEVLAELSLENALEEESKALSWLSGPALVPSCPGRCLLKPCQRGVMSPQPAGSAGSRAAGARGLLGALPVGTDTQHHQPAAGSALHHSWLLCLKRNLRCFLPAVLLRNGKQLGGAEVKISRNLCRSVGILGAHLAPSSTQPLHLAPAPPAVWLSASFPTHRRKQDHIQLSYVGSVICLQLLQLESQTRIWLR